MESPAAPQRFQCLARRDTATFTIRPINIARSLTLCQEVPTEMPEPDPNRIAAFETPEKLFKWFQLNHSTESELWVKLFKKNSRVTSVLGMMW